MGLLPEWGERSSPVHGEGVMQRSLVAGGATLRRSLLPVLLTALYLAVPISSTRADITPNGDVSPANPSTWTTSTDGYIGNTGLGTLTADGGSSLLSFLGYLGYQGSGVVNVVGSGTTWSSGVIYVGYYGSGTLSITGGGSVCDSYGYIGFAQGATGSVGVNGAGSSWTTSGDLYVGNNGSGTLSIANGANVTAAGTTYLGYQPGSAGAICFGPNGGTLTTNMLYTSAAALSGTGTINTCGLTADFDLILDSSHGLTQQTTIQGSGRLVTVNLSSSKFGSLI